MRGRTAVFLLALVCACGKQDEPRDATPPPRQFTDAEYVAAFNRGVNELEQHRFVEAAATFDELTRSRPALVAPWINLASAQLNRNVPDTQALCVAAADRATALDPKAPQPYFLRGVLEKHLGRYREAEAQLRKALELAPDDPATLYYLATVVVDRDVKEAERLFEKAIEGESHLQSAYYALAGVKRQTNSRAQADLLEIFQALSNSNTGDLMNIVYTEMGRLGEAVRDLPIAAESRPATRAQGGFEFSRRIRAEGLAVGTVELDGRPALACRNGEGALSAYQVTEGALSPIAGAFGGFRTAATELAVGDFDGDGLEDVACADIEGVRLLKSDGKQLGVTAENPLGGTRGAKGCCWSDLDQDGDLDLVVWTDDEAALLVNRRDGTFERPDSRTAAATRTFQAPPPPKTPKGVCQAIASDLDADGDPDILIGGAFGIRLWRNDRLMRFADVTERAGLDGAGPVLGLTVGDFDGDRALDFWALDHTLFRHVSKSPFQLTFSKTSIAPVPRTGKARMADVDGDGKDEILLVEPLLLCGVDRLVAGSMSGALAAVPNGGVVNALFADLDQDMALDLVVSGGSGTTALDTNVHLGRKPPGNHALEIRLKGRIFAKSMHSNMGGIGARVEVMAGNHAQVRELRSNEWSTLYFGLGARTHADYVRIVWPDDVLQSEGWVPGDQVKVVEELQRKASSCPILFAWNGERFECVTDFLGVGGLGFFLEPGVFGPPDPTEQVLIPRLVPKDGKLEIRIHEPFEEVAYLDSVRLLAIDHPKNVDVVPDERFAVNAPRPDGRLFAIRDRIDPVAAKDGRGRDVLKAVLASDRKQARAIADPRFLGYAERTTFELDFGEALAKRSGKGGLCLALDGWVEYPYSHVNLAAWQAGLKLEAMSIEVETKDRGFVRIQNEACYPAGMPRVMTLPLGRLPDGATGRLRLITNQELWIDRLFLFEPADAKLDVLVLHSSRADLRVAGYPREYSPDGGAPRLYDYDIMDPSFPWKTMAGTYTRFGDVTEVLREADDLTVIFGGGEEVALTFDAPAPPPPGFSRTWVLDTSGWCKDMDAYTAFPDTVEPLPFRAMSNYPYRDDESFPDGPAQQAWRAKYQTRTIPGTRARQWR